MDFEEKLSEFFNGKLFMALAWIAMVVSAFIATTSGEMAPESDGQGIFFSISPHISGSPMLSLALNTAVVTAIGALLLMLNKVYNFVRSVTATLASSFFLLTMANPLTSYALNTGTAMALIVTLGAFYTFASYNNPRSQRSVFLTFSAVTFCTMFQWAFVLLLPAFFLGFCYMRIMNWRSFTAMLLGIIVPFWIVLGLGIASIYDFKPFVFTSAWDSLDSSQLHLLLVSIAVTVVATIAITVVNLYTIIGYRLQLRVYNVFFMLVAMFTIAAMVVDYRDMHVFLPMLNLSLAVQMAHAFTINKSSRRYIFMAVLLLWSIASFIGILYI